MAFSPDGGRLATARLDRSVKLWDTSGEFLKLLPHTGNVLGVAFSPDGRRLASAGEYKIVRIWDANGREVLGLRGHTDSSVCVAFSPDGKRLAPASLDRTIRVWDATPLRGDEGQEVSTFAQHDEIRSVAISPEGERIVSAGGGGMIGGGPFSKIWNATTGQTIVEFPGHTVLVFSAAWHPDGQRIATTGTAGPRQAVKVWDARSGREQFDIQSGKDKFAVPFQVAVFSPGPESVALFVN